MDEPRAAHSERVRGSETILLVEDEDSVRHLTALFLGILGYRVIEASNGYDALRLFQAAPEKIDLLLTDVVMPGLSGREVAETLQALDSGLKVLFQSGYTDDTVVGRGMIHAGVAFLNKPFTLETLAMKVREALN